MLSKIIYFSYSFDISKISHHKKFQLSHYATRVTEVQEFSFMFLNYFVNNFFFNIRLICLFRNEINRKY